MSDKLSKEEVADIVFEEGLGYAVDDYLSYERIEDEELAEAWHEAHEALCNIYTLLADWL